MTRPAWRLLATVAALGGGLGLEGCGSGGRASAAGAPVPEAPAAEIDVTLFVIGDAGAPAAPPDTGYGFRRLPYHSRVQVRAGYATAAQTYRAELTGEFRGVAPPAVVTLHARASGIDVIRFYSFGNETVDTGSTDSYKVTQQQYLIAAALQFAVAPQVLVSVGPVFTLGHTRLEAGTFLDATLPRPYGVPDFSQVGAAADVRLDTRDRPQAASRGITVRVGGSVYPRALDATAAFGEGHAEAASYLGELGVFGLGDTGRVYLSGETSDRWHTAGGGGLWVAFLSRANTVSVAAADRGERMRLYVRAGFAF